MSNKIFGKLLIGVAHVFSELARSLDDEAAIETLLSGLNRAGQLETTIDTVRNELQPLPDDLDKVVNAAGKIDTDATPANLAAQLGDTIAAIAVVFKDADALAKRPPPSIAPFNDPNFWTAFFDHAFALVAYNLLYEDLPGVFAILRVLGVATSTPDGAGSVRWDGLADHLSDPVATLVSEYTQGGILAIPALFDAALEAAAALGLVGTISDTTQSTKALWAESELAASSNSTIPFQISVLRALANLGDDGGAVALIDISIQIVPIPATTGGAGPAVGVALALTVEGQATFDVPLTPDVNLHLVADGEGAAWVELRPAETKVARDGGSGLLRTDFEVVGAPQIPWRWGEEQGSHVEITRFEVGIGVLAGTAARPEAHANIEIKGTAALDLSDADGFLATVIGGMLSASIDMTIGWSTNSGLTFLGGAGIQGAVALDFDFGGFLHLTTLAGGISVSGTGVVAQLLVSGDLSLGPVGVTVTSIGFAITASPSIDKARPGNLGPVQVDLGFKPPRGLGIALNAGPITGGGFIDFDKDAGRYAGVLSLSLYNIKVKAIGLLDTKLPNNTPGYSFLIIISVEFTPIQLGFGFTLNGVGGLAGINRNFVVDAIQAGLRQHSLDHILFPKDPIKNAPAIISDLRAIFPPAEGRYVFGPMLELGWGGGANLVTAELGVLLSLPAPVVIAVLGQLTVTLPKPDAAAVELHLDVLGVIDFGQKTFSLDAVLHDSRIVAFPISGEMAMRLSWGQNPSFALSIGGTNPQWNQLPAGFPNLKRLTIALSASSALRLTIQSYLAITSNTFQFGARAELYIGSGSFNVYGWIGFDALLIFTPFSFVVDFTAGLALRSGTSTLMGISVDGELSGPTPWHAKGDAHISILFFEISVHIDTTWGDAAQVEAPVVDAWGRLHDAIANLGNWSGALPASVPAVATLATPGTDTTASVLVDPSGVLTLRERVLPLNQTLTKFGEAIPRPQNAFLLEPGHVTLGSVTPPFTIVRDKFAPAQFEQLSDQEKLSRPSFEDRDAGFTIGAGQLSCGTAVGLDVAYADAYVDDLAPPDDPPPFQPALEQQLAWARINAAANCGLLAAAMGKYAPPPTAPQLLSYAEERFVVATTTDLTGRLDISRPVTKGEAYQALAAHLTTNPHERGRLQVVPTYELAP